MAFRTSAYFKIQSATSVPQPLVGSWITSGAAVGSNVVLTLGTATAGGNDATNIFLQTDLVYIINPDGSNAEWCRLSAVANNTVTVKSIANTHASGAFGTGSFIMPANWCNNVYIQPKDGNTGTLFLGSAYNFQTPSGANPGFRMMWEGMKVAASSQPTDFSATLVVSAGGGNAIPENELWITGTQNDLYLPTFVVSGTGAGASTSL